MPAEQNVAEQPSAIIGADVAVIDKRNPRAGIHGMVLLFGHGFYQ